jgi:hypothetical protein
MEMLVIASKIRCHFLSGRKEKKLPHASFMKSEYLTQVTAEQRLLYI